jgi:uncharacterized protein YjeT (DUF2065 family)
MTTLLALLLGGLYIFMVVRPEQFRQMLNAFPRSIWPGRILAAIDMIWVITVLHNADFGGFNWIKGLLVKALPALDALPLGIFNFLKDPVVLAGIAAYFLIIKYLDELLAPRALGGLMLLIANPILNAARWLDTPWRLVVVVVAYIIVIKGILLVLSPFKLRKYGEKLLNNDQKCRLFGQIGLIFAVFLCFLGIFAYN